MLPFIFDASRGETPEQLARQRALAAHFASKISGRPAQNVGEGIGNALNSIGHGIAANILNRRAQAGEQAGMSGANSLRDQFAAWITGSQNFPAAPSPDGGASTSGLLSSEAGALPSTNASNDGDDMTRYQNAIASIESAGSGDYAAIGPTHAKMGRALGRYQIMESNIAPWSQAALGRTVTPDEFMKNPQVQDAIFNHRFGQYVNQYGPEGAAQAWFAGPGGVGKTGRRDSLGTSVGAYTTKFNNALGGGAPAVNAVNALPEAQPQQPGPLGLDVAAYAPGAQAAATPAGQRVLGNMLAPQPMAGGAGIPLQPPPGPAAAQPQPGPGGISQADFDARWNGAPSIPQPPAQSPSPFNAFAPVVLSPTPPQDVLAPSSETVLDTPAQPPQIAPAGQPPAAPQPALSRHNIDAGMPMAGAAGNMQPPPPNMGLLLEVMSNSFMPPEIKAMAAQQIQQYQQSQDPRYRMQLQADKLGLEKSQLEIDALRSPPRETTTLEGRLIDKSTGEVIRDYGPRPTGDMQEYEAYAADERAAGRQPLGRLEYEQAIRSSGATRINNNNIGEGDKFYENLDKKNAETFSALSEAGVQGRTKMAQIDRLDELLSRSPQGAAAMFKQIAGEYGINTDGLNDLQAAQALINELVPQQRQPGSGPMSDADLALYKASLPRLINQPEGNKLIIETMRAITRYQVQMGDIADLVADREISPAEGRKMIRELANPLAGFSDRAAKFGQASSQGGRGNRTSSGVEWSIEE